MINSADIAFGDKHLSLFAQDLGYGFYTPKIDLAIFEVTGIKEDGSLILAGSVGVVPEILQIADKVLLEINTSIPSFEGLHDLIVPVNPPNRLPFMIMRPTDRMGSPYVKLDPDKIVGIIES
mmetsp:Transcript_3121/g.1830  ORF Transcript_3121/g.1830 Transcript_3121/m.1830 type:complete len:122 (-) Transcript_3121:531-896(-)